MQDKCIEAVTRAAGRALTKAEIDGIEARVRAGMRSVMNKDIDAWNSMSADQRTMEGAKYARDQLIADAEHDKFVKQLQIARQIDTTSRINKELFADPDKANDKRAREKAVKNDILATYTYAEGIKRDYMRNLTGSIESAKHGQGFFARAFEVTNPAMYRDIIREIYRGADGSTSNPVAKAAARAIIDVNESARRRFNAVGGRIGDLGYGYVPIIHSMVKVLGDGSDAARHAWARFVLPRLNRSMYLDDYGNVMNDAALMKVLSGDDREPWRKLNAEMAGHAPPRQEGIWDTIAAGGINKIVPGETTGTGALANRGSQHRVLHFKDADAHIEYNEQYGEGSLLSALIRHVGGISKNIALVDRYGPNGTKNIRTQMQLTAIHDGTQLRTLEGGMTSIGAYWNYITGLSNTPVNPALARRFALARTVVAAIRLQGTVLTAIGDLSTLFVTAHYNKVPFFKTMATAARLVGPGSREYRDWLSSQGLIAETLESGMNRFGVDNVATNYANHLSAATMKLQGLDAWTDSLRTAFQSHMMRGLGKMASKEWDELSAWDQKRLSNSNITKDDWDIINRSELGEYGGSKYLTPDAIYASGDPRARDVVAKVLGMIKDEGEFAVLNPDLKTRVAMATIPGTVPGELARTFLQFKAFPIAMITRHWGRAFEMYRTGDYKLDGAPKMANPWTYAAALVVSSTIMGAISNQAYDLVSGKDPEKMWGDGSHWASFWGRAFTRGGGAGFLGDMINSAMESHDFAGVVGSVASGPVGGLLFQPLHIAQQNATDAAEGKPTHVGADLFKFGTSNIPLLNLWYLKTVINRLFWDNISENLSPGVTARNMRRSEKLYGNQAYWQPGQRTPSRAPNLGAAIGQ